MGTTLKCEYPLGVGFQSYTYSLGVTVMEDISIPRRECEDAQDAGGETGSNGCRCQPATGNERDKEERCEIIHCGGGSRPATSWNVVAAWEEGDKE